jgi:hypothetical protein
MQIHHPWISMTLLAKGRKLCGMNKVSTVQSILLDDRFESRVWLEGTE